MHYAAENNAVEVAKVLIDHGAQLCEKEDFVCSFHPFYSNIYNMTDRVIRKDGWQPSHVAAGLNAVDVEALLVASGSDPCAPTYVLSFALTNRLRFV